MHTKTKGDIAEAFVTAKFLQLGWRVLRPVGDNQRYDLVIDRGNGFETVQVKTARFYRNALQVQLCSSQCRAGKGKKKYFGQIDLVAGFYPADGSVYLLTLREVGDITEVSLRLDTAQNGQQAKVRMAAEYKL